MLQTIYNTINAKYLHVPILANYSLQMSCYTLRKDGLGDDGSESLPAVCGGRSGRVGGGAEEEYGREGSKSECGREMHKWWVWNVEGRGIASVEEKAGELIGWYAGWLVG